MDSFDLAKFEKKLEYIGSDRERFDAIITKTEELREHDTSKALTLAKLATALAEKSAYVYGKAFSAFIMGTVYYRTGELKTALQCGQESLAVFQTLNDVDADISRVHNFLGLCFLDTAQMEKSLHHFAIALHGARHIGDTEREVFILQNMGLYKYYAGDINDSLLHFRNAIQLINSTNNKNLLAAGLHNLGSTLTKAGQLEEAQHKLLTALQLSRELQNENLEAETLDELGLVYTALKNYSEAAKCFEQGLQLAEKARFRLLSVSIQINQAKLFYEQDRYSDARSRLEIAFLIAEQAESSLHLKEIYLLFMKIYKASAMYKEALEAYEAFYDVESRIVNKKAQINMEIFEKESLKETTERLTVLSDIGRKILSVLDMNLLLETVYKHVNQLMDARTFSVASYNEENGDIVFELFIENGQRGKLYQGSIHNKHSLAGRCLLDEKDIFISNIYTEAQQYNIEIEQTPRFGEDSLVPVSLMYIPLFFQKKPIGVITVQSYVEKAYTLNDLETLRILSNYVSVALHNAKQAALIHEQNEKLNMLAALDDLTGLKNRRVFLEHLGSLWQIAGRTGLDISLILMDVDFFKRVNDNFGHLVGDECLVNIAKILDQEIHRSADMLARFGGEEFVLVLADTKCEDAFLIAERLRKSVENVEWKAAKKSAKITLSCGVSSAKPSLDRFDSIEALINRADRALYEAKAAGRNNTQICNIEA